MMESPSERPSFTAQCSFQDDFPTGLSHERHTPMRCKASKALPLLTCALRFLQMIISAFYSGMRGGKLIADGLFGLLEENGLLEKV